MANWTPEEKIVKARIDFIHHDCVFLGNLSLRLRLVEAEWLPTAGTDGFHLYYNPHFIDRLDLDETKFVVAHEVMHCTYEHMIRRNARDAQMWNIAGDYVINLELKDINVGRFINNDKFVDPAFIEELKEKAPKAYKKWKKDFQGQPGVLCDEKFRGMGSEEVFEALKQEQQGQQGQQGQKSQGGGQCGDCGGSGQQDDGQGGQEDCESCDGSGQEDGQPGQGSGGYQGPTSWDSHIEPDGSGSGDEGDGTDPSGKEGPVPVSQEEMDRLPDDIRKAVMDAAAVAETAEGGAGNIPAGVRRLIKEWTDSQMDWREYLNNVIQSSLKSDYTWMRASRKSQPGGCYLPGMDNDDMVSVDIAIDTSGSMTEQMLKDILGEVRGIMEQFADFRMRVWCFDTQTYDVWTFGPDNIDEIDEFEMVGGGGTDFMCNWYMMQEQDIVPDQLIFCTDGMPCGSWGDPDYCDTVFLIHGQRQIEAPFGVTVYYEDAKKS